MRGLTPSFAVAAAFAVAVACHHDAGGPTDAGGFDLSNLASCGTRTDVFTVLPLDPQAIMGWVPLGALNPSGHTFPTDHQYLYLTSFGTSGGSLNLYAPGDIYVTGAGRTQYGGSQPTADYSLSFSACRETWGNFGHVGTIAPQILAKLGAFDVGCNTYSPTPGNPVTACYTSWTTIPVKAGELIGTTAGLDLSWFDNRVPPITYANPSRWTVNASGFDHFHVVPFSDYYAEPLRSTVQAMMGSFNGKVRRTVAPIGGTIATDVAGTVQGTWFFGSEPTYPESPHLAIVPDNIVPSRIDISMGTSGGTFTSGLTAMVPSASGPFNVHPARIAPGPTIYCWDLINSFDLTPGAGIALVQLVDAITLRIEGRLGANHACATEQAFAFTASVVTYKR